MPESAEFIAAQGETRFTLPIGLTKAAFELDRERFEESTDLMLKSVRTILLNEWERFHA